MEDQDKNQEKVFNEGEIEENRTHSKMHSEKMKKYRANFLEHLSSNEVKTLIEQESPRTKLGRGPLSQHLDGALIDEEKKEIYFYLNDQKEKRWLSHYSYIDSNTIKKWETPKKKFEQCQKDYSNFICWTFGNGKSRDQKDKQKAERRSHKAEKKQTRDFSVRNCKISKEDASFEEESKNNLNQERLEEKNLDENGEISEEEVSDQLSDDTQSKLQKKEKRKALEKQKIALRSRVDGEGDIPALDKDEGTEKMIKSSGHCLIQNNNDNQPQIFHKPHASLEVEIEDETPRSNEKTGYENMVINSGPSPFQNNNDQSPQSSFNYENTSRQMTGEQNDLGQNCIQTHSRPIEQVCCGCPFHQPEDIKYIDSLFFRIRGGEKVDDLVLETPEYFLRLVHYYLPALRSWEYEIRGIKKSKLRDLRSQKQSPKKVCAQPKTPEFSYLQVSENEENLVKEPLLSTRPNFHSKDAKEIHAPSDDIQPSGINLATIENRPYHQAKSSENFSFTHFNLDEYDFLKDNEFGMGSV